jgi:zinc protease
MDDLAAASYQDVVDFYTQYYVPNNATLSIAGDFDIDEARALAEKWFSEIPRGADVQQIEATKPRLDGETRLTLEDRVQLPRLHMAWHAPAYFAPGDAEMDLISDLLASGRNSRLYQRLVYELEIADDVSAFQNSRRLSSMFMLTATARSGHTLDELEAVINEEIERLHNEPPSERELQRIKNSYETRFYEQVEPLLTRADRLALYDFYTGNPDYFEEDLSRYRAIDAADLSRMAERYLPLDRRVVLSIVPAGSLELAAEGSTLVDAN